MFVNKYLRYLKNYLYSFTFSHELSAKHYACLKFDIRKKRKKLSSTLIHFVLK